MSREWTRDVTQDHLDLLTKVKQFNGEEIKKAYVRQNTQLDALVMSMLMVTFADLAALTIATSVDGDDAKVGDALEIVIHELVEQAAEHSKNIKERIADDRAAAVRDPR